MTPLQRQLLLAKTINSELRATAGKSSSRVRFQTIVQGWAWQFGLPVKGVEGAGASGTAAPVPVEEVGVTRLYRRVARYWEDEAVAPATVDGMLGGYGHTSADEMAESIELLMTLREARPELRFSTAVDCGGGIGRVVAGVLAPLFDAVDLVEPNERFLATAVRSVDPGKLRAATAARIQDFAPTPGSYDVIWMQWVVGYLTDVDFVEALQRFSKALRPGGVIVVKDNTLETCKALGFWIDADDGYFIRSQEYHERVFQEAGMRVLRKAQQLKWPEDAYPVFMYALEAGEADVCVGPGGAAAPP